MKEKKVYFWMSKVTNESLMMLVTMVTARRDAAAGVGLRICLQFLLYLSFASRSLIISSRQASSHGKGGTHTPAPRQGELLASYPCVYPSLTPVALCVNELSSAIFPPLLETEPAPRMHNAEFSFVL